MGTLYTYKSSDWSDGCPLVWLFMFSRCLLWAVSYCISLFNTVFFVTCWCKFPHAAAIGMTSVGLQGSSSLSSMLARKNLLFFLPVHWLAISVLICPNVLVQIAICPPWYTDVLKKEASILFKSWNTEIAPPSHGNEISVYCHLFQNFDLNILERKYGLHLELNCSKKKHFSWQEQCLLVITCNIGIHPGPVEPASPIELTTGRTDALQAERSYASSLETFSKWGLAWSYLLVASAGPQFACAAYDVVLEEVGSLSVWTAWNLLELLREIFASCWHYIIKWT